MVEKAYRHDRDAQTFRKALVALKDATRIGSQALLDELARETKHTAGIERAALDAFLRGRASKRAAALGTLHDFLWAHKEWGPIYRERFLAENATPIAGDFPSALTAFFTPRGSVKNRYSMEIVRESLPGRYLMMRRDFEQGAEPDDVRSSLITIEAMDDNVTVEELQDYQQRHDTYGYRQRDDGYVFSYADYVYWLMREAGNNTATAIKLGVINYAAPDIGDGLADFFSGYMFVSSRRGIFPLARFACRRYALDLHPPKSGIIKLSDIRDPRVLSYIKLDCA